MWPNVAVRTTMYELKTMPKYQTLQSQPAPRKNQDRQLNSKIDFFLIRVPPNDFVVCIRCMLQTIIGQFDKMMTAEMKDRENVAIAAIERK